jgi:squalene-hopene/tetraprenyl-beta-curcumene cyclase
MDRDRLDRAYDLALKALLSERAPEGHWVGELSTSALSTATAVSALALVQREREPPGPHDRLIAEGLAWLAAHQNPDGGWGDTVKSISNISTTMLCRAAFHIAGKTSEYLECLGRATKHIQERYGDNPKQQAEAVRARYGKDRTFAVPILTTCALAGLVDWREVKPLPFELACLPRQWYPLLRLPVVSYALPALIAVGQAVYYHRPPRNPITRLLRWLSLNRSLAVLEAIQPASGGFLEATPLTSFVVLSLASIGQAKHPVARHGLEFLIESVRPDGSWPIDTNLSTWVTTLAINALAAAGALRELERKPGVRFWLLGQQFTSRHPYTGAAPGGWGWTPLPGSVPDGDDTAGALLALANLTETIPDEPPHPSPRALARANLGDLPEYADRAASLPRLPDLAWESRTPIHNGLWWLLRLQNIDRGWPTFCRGWGTLPFDRSGTDLTAHALRAFAALRPQIEADRAYLHALADAGQATRFTGFPLPPIAEELARGLEFLEKQQRPDGSWVPLWFGNQHAPGEENPTYGTARVLAAYRDLKMMDTEPARRGLAWLLKAQNPDGGWGGAAGVASSIEETALAVEILLDLASGEAESTADSRRGAASYAEAVNKGLGWLVEQMEAGALTNPTPIGFYFAKLWYFEKLYPIIFSVAALGRARRVLQKTEAPTPANSP